MRRKWFALCATDLFRFSDQITWFWFFTVLIFFTVLREPAEEALAEELFKQYDVSEHFPGDDRFKGLLLSPRGLKPAIC